MPNIKSLTASFLGALVMTSNASTAATVDISYDFQAIYAVDCQFNECGESTEFLNGDFTLALSYNNVSILNEQSFPEGNTTTGVRYGGETTARFTTPIGDISFNAIGRGDLAVTKSFLDSGDRFFFLELNEIFSSIFQPNTNYFRIGGVTFFTEEDFVDNAALYSFYVSDPDRDESGIDSPISFRLQNDAGIFISSEVQIDLQGLRITVSEDIAPSVPQVPLPASAPLLIAGLSAFGMWRRIRC